jgi:uncharacterized protein YqgV (UPF0045/DUF77 family)
MFVSAQISLYPLRDARLSPIINQALDTLKKHGLTVSPGAMSSLVSGDDEVLFAALKEAFQKSSSEGDVVMVVTLSNACPVSQ